MRELIDAVIEWADSMEVVVNATRKIANAASIIFDEITNISNAIEDKH